ncbi:zinc transporter zipt-7.2-like [Artemia franciscana]|uniref:Uncharacterized protein n=1 Tax=Artemia franciscana TaxID=6661 RepID=A0AA88H4J8_ARTSF|nr:hypothetical protein QYM36_019985 [Artemia franciscana]KAK2720803.1 hypothetical protein QYM36_004617 [Artemia franciscana]
MSTWNNQDESESFSKDISEGAIIGTDGVVRGKPETFPATAAELKAFISNKSLFFSFITTKIYYLFLAPMGDSLLKVLISFTSGGILGDAFLHLIPPGMIMMEGAGHGHSHSHDHEHKPHDMSVGLWVIFGILTFLMVDKCVRIAKGGYRHSHSEKFKIEEKEKEAKEAQKDGNKNSDKNGKDTKKNSDSKENTEKTERSIKVAAFLNLAADFTHKFKDGLAKGGSFLVGRPIGIITTVTVFVLVIPHKISFCLNAATSWIIPFIAGGSIYGATVLFIPKILEKSSFKQSIFEIIAFIVGVYYTF